MDTSCVHTDMLRADYAALANQIMLPFLIMYLFKSGDLAHNSMKNKYRDHLRLKLSLIRKQLSCVSFLVFNVDKDINNTVKKGTKAVTAAVPFQKGTLL